MDFSSVHIPLGVQLFFRTEFSAFSKWEEVNAFLQRTCGLPVFFENADEFNDFKLFLDEASSLVAEPDRTEYGDFQTNASLADRVVEYLIEKKIDPEIVIEPTFGKGNFILAALRRFKNLKQIVGVEIYRPYFWETKFAILDHFLQNPKQEKPLIRLYHQDVFEFDFQKLNRGFSGNNNILILGNPPWVTNAKLSTLQSDNLPAKSNFKKLGGLDAITGKGNFDIGEFITLTLLRAFERTPGWMAFLVKNAVIKNIIFDQKDTRLHINQLIQWPIDAKKEFGASVEASLLYCRFNESPGDRCLDTQTGNEFGWVDNQFVANAAKYTAFRKFDGVCPFEWRQGVKHDCSGVMELERENGHFRTSGQAAILLEQDLVYGLLKSSELKGGVVSTSRKYTIVTQKRIGQDTAYIRQLYPLTFKYLQANQEQFALRKSSIYKGKPPFSIFGIGDYSFLPYKVAISGLYKSATFTLVLPQDDKPVMLDDTCYFIGFESLTDALFTFALLNHPFTRGLLATITFPDAKRMYTKDVLMRIDLAALAAAVSCSEIQSLLSAANGPKAPSEQEYYTYVKNLHPSGALSPQLELF